MIINKLKKYLPENLVRRINKIENNSTAIKLLTNWRNFTNKFNRVKFVFISKLQFTSNLYYAFVSNAYGREHKATIVGRLHYLEELERPQKNNYLLRRNIHRLEKGLTMQPRKNIFAEDYIIETVQMYRVCIDHYINNNYSFNDELLWASDVLKLYFESVQENDTINRAKKQFYNSIPVTPEEHHKIPYIRNSHELPSVSYGDLYKLAVRRRSVRWFIQKPVPRDVIDKALQIANLAPSACNRQPFEFRIFDDPEKVKRIAVLPIGTPGYAHNIPCIAVVVGKLRAYFSERDRHGIYIDGSLATMSFILALETLGVSSCCINWADIGKREKKMQHELSLSDDDRPIMLIAIGYPDPDALVAYSQKKELDELRRYN